MRAFSQMIDRFCYRHPRFGIPNLMRYIVFISVAVYLLDMIDRTGTFVYHLYFVPSLILHGQVWRLVSWIFIPIYGNILFTALALYFYFFIGSLLESRWGTAKFSLFYFAGVLFHIILGFSFDMTGLVAHYLNLSMFFAVASLYPDMQVLLWFILPVKIKWLAWVDAAFFVWGVFSLSGIYKLMPVIAILNYLLFFGEEILDRFGSGARQMKQKRRTVQFRSAAKAAKESKGYLHKCAVCGRTDTDYPDLEFRYCSKCYGYYCYCQDHINNHVHIQ